VAAKAGLLETADGGTVFLDEIGDLPPAIQVKLLRVIEERRLRRVGAVKARALDVRFIAATNRDLAADVALGRFREDLYYRLNGISLSIPPLRARINELPTLTRELVAAACKRAGRPPVHLASDTMAALLAHPWPGNIRELRNVVERAVIMSDPKLLHGDPLDAVAELRKRAEPAMHRRVSLRAARDATEREYLEDLVRATDWDLDQAATIAEVHRKSLERLLREHRIKRR
jgi:DNA-binding NtrC family response regulator